MTARDVHLALSAAVGVGGGASGFEMTWRGLHLALSAALCVWRLVREATAGDTHLALCAAVRGPCGE